MTHLRTLIFVATAFAVGCGGWASAQTPDEYHSQAVQTGRAMQPRESEAAILESLRQRSQAGRRGSGGNVARILQSGDGNRSVIEQSGRGNLATVGIVSSSGNSTRQEQRGLANASEVQIIRGGGNDLTTVQVGDGNEGGIVLRDTFGQTVIFKQEGNGLKSAPISVESDAPQRDPIVIEQRR